MPTLQSLTGVIPFGPGWLSSLWEISFAAWLCDITHPFYCPAMHIFSEHLSEPEEFCVLH